MSDQVNGELGVGELGDERSESLKGELGAGCGLYDFFVAFSNWLERGESQQSLEHGLGFSRYYGLCSNLNKWLLDRDHRLFGTDQHGQPRGCLWYARVDEFQRALQALFADRGLDRATPFDADELAYERAAQDHTLYVNQGRLSFIREACAGRTLTTSQIERAVDAFYIDIDKAAPRITRHTKRELFEPVYGLCQNFVFWQRAQGVERSRVRTFLNRELTREFTAAGMDSLYPFNAGRAEKYNAEENTFLNPRRRKWIRDRAAVALVRMGVK
ncbi:hypothetical protein H1O16_gp323 [Burkholderia phage BcepSaruman]|uniref:Uncharacterized protein n=1 Tax=Burkholderia phage BcepSaruman TaxID=2530032 RepID=A0A4D5ZDT4_9CAUD|nr:hypothetical protein H1O16_gp323 [Burkholderia phage BcepSaruman]QBX06736.1 hypothetical protein BcepSaruman_323 [Burkholderia phage BcepSaruman]